MTRSARRSAARVPERAVGAAPAVKPGRHREATLYHALHGAGAAGDGRTLAQLREAARAAYERLELPVWRRSGFWTTSLQDLDLDALEPSSTTRGRQRGKLPDVVTRTLPERSRAGRLVQGADGIVNVELDPALAERGVILCSLEEAVPRAHGAGRALVLQAPADRPPQARGRERRLLARRRLPVRARRAWRGGPLRDRLRDRAPRRGPVRAHARGRRRRQRVPAARVRPGRGLRRVPRGQAPGAARGGLRDVPAGRRALPAGPGAGLGRGRGLRRLHALRGSRPRRLLPLAAGAAGRAPGAPAPRAGRVRDGRRDGLPRDVLHRGARAPRPVRRRPPRDRPLRGRRPLARDRHRREPGELRGADPDRPGRPADPHLPADPLDDALAEGAHRRDPIGAGVRRRRLGLPRRHRRRARRDRDLLHAVARPGPRRRPCA